MKHNLSVSVVGHQLKQDSLALPLGLLLQATKL